MLMLEDKYNKMVNIFNKFIKNKSNFGTYDSDDTCPEIEDILNYLYYHENEFNLGQIKVGSGVSKAVLIAEDLDCVLKVPFVGRFYGSYDDKKDEYIEEFYPFQYGAGENENDYCLKEVNIYWTAAEHGIEMLFAKSEIFCTLDCGLPVYKQTKVIPYGDSEKKSASESSIKTVKNKYSYEPCRNEWKALVIDYYGEEVLQKFFDFIDNICPDAGEDLHCGNYGYTLDGRPVLLDYSGWGDY